MVSGEGIALGLLLMMIGARMPKQLGEVAVVCVHRRETLGPIEAMYNELVNMQSHREQLPSFTHMCQNADDCPDVLQTSSFFTLATISRFSRSSSPVRSVSSSMRRGHLADGFSCVSRTGFLIIPSLTALQQGMALQAFCEQSRERAACNSTVVAHPASIVLARSRLPQ